MWGNGGGSSGKALVPADYKGHELASYGALLSSSKSVMYFFLSNTAKKLFDSDERLRNLVNKSLSTRTECTPRDQEIMGLNSTGSRAFPLLFLIHLYLTAVCL